MSYLGDWYEGLRRRRRLLLDSLRDETLSHALREDPARFNSLTDSALDKARQDLLVRGIRWRHETPSDR